MVIWSELPSDVLGLITSFLSVQDYHRFGAVCQKWSKVAKQKFHSPAQMLPWLVLGEDKDTKKRKFYDLLEDRHYYLDVPELNGTFLCGSKYGWFFALDQKLNFHLVNPLTRECDNLPSPPAYYEGYFADVALCLGTESDDEEARGRKLEALQKILLLKATLDYDPDTTIEVQGDHNLFDGYSFRYIVDLDGELLIADRLLELLEHMIAKEIVVHKLDLERESITACRHIEGCTVFLGTNSPTTINPDRFLGCEKDAIYFTDLVYDDNHTRYGAEDLGAYDLVENTITPYYPTDEFHSLIDAPIWFTPNPW